MLHICCYSGGHSSAIVAIEVVRRYGKNDVILLNHNINPNKEHRDIKRFKQEVASYLGVKITYANCLGIEDEAKIPDQFEVCEIAKAFKVGNGTELCTNRLKTAPFFNFLEKNVKGLAAKIYYGFDKKELHRVVRRRKILNAMGYESEYPLAEWKNRTIENTEEIAIQKPLTYSVFKHGNCIGCLKAGLQHWYCVYCYFPEIFQRGKISEERIGYSIHKEGYLREFELKFEAMQLAGVTPTEHMSHQKFWSIVNKTVPGINYQPQLFEMPCECAF